MALRQCPNRDTGYSPFPLVYGRSMRTPLDVVYSNWAEKSGSGMDINDWVVQLEFRLMVLRNAATHTGLLEAGKRATAERKIGHYNQETRFYVGSQAWLVSWRIPGSVGILSWDIKSQGNYR